MLFIKDKILILVKTSKYKRQMDAIIRKEYLDKIEKYLGCTSSSAEVLEGRIEVIFSKYKKHPSKKSVRPNSLIHNINF